MSTKNTHANNKKLLMVFALAGVLLLAGMVGAFMFQDNIKSVATGVSSGIANENRPKFVFDAEKFPDWISSGNTRHDGTNDPNLSREERVASATLGAYQCALGSNCSALVNDNLVEDGCRSTSKQLCEEIQQLTDAGMCAVHVNYFNYPVDPGSAIAEDFKPTPGFKQTTHEIDVKSLSMSTPEGIETYQLHQFDNDNSGGYKKGVSVGYIPLENSHIKVQGICDESSQLDEVLPVLKAIRLTI